MRSRSVVALATVFLLGACAEFEPTTELVIPKDERAAVKAEDTPPPVSGGTLRVLRDGATAIVADPDRDRVSVVDLDAERLLHTVALEPGDEPGRVVEGDDGIVHVVLRGADAVATLDAASGAVLGRRAACAAPRGIAHDATTGELHIACASGRLVTFAGGEAAPSRVLELRPDLRDVILDDSGQLLVTTFKDAALHRVTTSGTLSLVGAPQPVERTQLTEEGSRAATFTGGQAWRAARTPDGQTIVVHQRGQLEEVVLTEPTPEQPSSYGGGSSSTGFSGDCQGIVESAVTLVDDSGRVRSSGGLFGNVLPVDVAVSEGGRIAVANAGLRDPGMPQPFVVHHSADGEDLAPRAGSSALPPTAVSILDTASLGGGSGGCFPSFGGEVFIHQPVTAVAFGSDELLVAQTREPAQLHLVHLGTGGGTRIIELGGESVLDTGHEIFHRDTGAGIACASCHGEGGEDGRVWTFAGLGPRRTQALHVGLEGTAPFHWDGEMTDLGHLVSEVFVGRMGGVRQSGDRLDALQSYLFALEPPTPMVAASAPGVDRGREVFERAGCDTCHGGEAFTSAGSFDVGTGGALQVPSLRGIGYRAPFIHTGCADTLEERFDPACGGEAHGATEGLSEADRADLITYLQSL